VHVAQGRLDGVIGMALQRLALPGKACRHDLNLACAKELGGRAHGEAGYDVISLLGWTSALVLDVAS